MDTDASDKHAASTFRIGGRMSVKTKATHRTPPLQINSFWRTARLVAVFTNAHPYTPFRTSPMF